MASEERMKTILTGDRPTGKLHLGHYFGTLQNRVKLQDDYRTMILIADLQVLTDHIEAFGKIQGRSFELMLDYLSVGLKPSNIYLVQSQVPELAELATYFYFLVSVARAQRNPTLKNEMEVYGVSKMSVGMMIYPVSQASDILSFKADLVPVGQDQVPHVEQTREVARDFNKTFGHEVFHLPEALVGDCPTLVGTNGQSKMSKSLDNYISLSHSPEETIQRTLHIVTDPSRARATDPGHPEVCTAYKYQELFASPDDLATVEFECRAGKRGCRDCKQELAARINQRLEPIRERRVEYAAQPDLVWDILRTGTLEARRIAAGTLEEVRDAMGLGFPKLWKP